MQAQGQDGIETLPRIAHGKKTQSGSIEEKNYCFFHGHHFLGMLQLRSPKVRDHSGIDTDIPHLPRLQLLVMTETSLS